MIFVCAEHNSLQMNYKKMKQSLELRTSGSRSGPGWITAFKSRLEIKNRANLAAGFRIL